MGFYFYFGILLYFVCVIIKHTFSAGTSNVEEKELFKGLTQADIKYISCNIKLSNIKENVNQYLIEQYELDDTEVKDIFDQVDGATTLAMILKIVSNHSYSESGVIRFTVDQVTYCTKIIIENDVDKDGFLTIDELTTVLCKFIDGKIVKNDIYYVTCLLFSNIFCQNNP
ncbi:uncharacterized protein LOC126906095 isoform X2 [Daktulosphaira vitifoliae]|uniref:uncharacterized protein LOC126906095 isoform X2 n=1 Tax=Daktulosphaira vitifoliae TaxID=58002 RepID=UPI0021AAD314|nr:uncharacterized protein LOC126906095 isoform X2 [Daktulosphaira vitifoliae]